MFDWKLKFQNKTFLTTFTLAILTFIYQLLGIFEVVPKISESELTNLVMIVINLLTALGIVVNPNTDGISDKDSVANSPIDDALYESSEDIEENFYEEIDE